MQGFWFLRVGAVHAQPLVDGDREVAHGGGGRRRGGRPPHALYPGWHVRQLQAQARTGLMSALFGYCDVWKLEN